MVFGVRQAILSVFFFYFPQFFVVLIEGHIISGRCEWDKDGSGVKKTGKLRSG